MKLSIVLSTDPAQFEAVAFKGDFETNLERIAEIGYEGVELAIRDPETVDVDRLQNALDRYGLRVPAIGTGQAFGEDKLSFTDARPEVRKKAIDRVKSHINLASNIESLVILGLIRGVTPAGVSPHHALGWLVDALTDCSETASQRRVKLVLEPINRYETDLINTIEEGLALINQVGAPEDVLGLLPDTFHMNIEEPSICGSLARAAQHIYHFHVADSNRWYPGAGHLDFVEILSLLHRELNYTGWVSAEILPKPDPLQAAVKTYEHMQSCLSNWQKQTSEMEA